MSFSSETPYKRWYGTEILSHAPGAVDLTRLNDIGTVLFSHGFDKNYGRVPIAKIKNISIDSTENKCRAVVEFDTDEDSDKIYQKVIGGFIKGVSVGYRILEYEELTKKGQKSADSRFTADEDNTYIATKWQPYEISIEPTPADPDVGIGRGINGGNFMQGNNTPIIPTNDNLIQAERTRITEISALSKTHNLDLQRFIEDGSDIGMVRQFVLDELAKRSPAIPSVSIVEDESEKFVKFAGESILLRGGIEHSSVEKAAENNKYRNMSLIALAAECLERKGTPDVKFLDKDEILRRALTPDSQFSAILDSAVSKTMAKAYASAPTTYQAWTSKGSRPDFKAAKIYQISEAGDLKLMKQNGEFEFDEMQDTNISESIATYGRKFGLTREAIVNDDLDIITRIPQAYVRAAARGLNKLVYTTLTSADTCKSANNNIGTAGALSATTLGELRKLMRMQKNLRSKEVLNINGRYLLLPATLEITAAELLNSTAKPSGSHSGVQNFFRNAYESVVDAELDAISTTAYYLVADPNECESIRVSFLNGKDSPQLESRTSWDTLGMDWRIYMDYGVTLVDYRGIAKNAGA